MQEFASSAMLRLLQAGLAAQGIVLPDLPREDRAHVPLERKRGLLVGLHERLGALPLLRAGEAVASLPPEPLLQALLRAVDLPDLFDRWSRLERFSHSSHRLDIASHAGEWRIGHDHRSDGPPPHPAETALVFGLVVSLAEHVAGRHAIVRGEGVDLRLGGQWLAPPQGPDIRLQLHAPEARITLPTAHASLSARLRGLVLADPARRWDIATLAKACALSRRSLQRALEKERTSVTGIIRAARLEVCGDLLLASEEQPLAAIGFVTGFSDQAHFTRSFAAAVGQTPAAFRRDFAAR